MLDRVRDGDIIRLDSHEGVLEAKVAQEVLRSRAASVPDLSHNEHGVGRELFASFRRAASEAEAGAIALA